MCSLKKNTAFITGFFIQTHLVSDDYIFHVLCLWHCEEHKRPGHQASRSYTEIDRSRKLNVRRTRRGTTPHCPAAFQDTANISLGHKMFYRWKKWVKSKDTSYNVHWRPLSCATRGQLEVILLLSYKYFRIKYLCSALSLTCHQKSIVFSKYNLAGHKVITKWCYTTISVMFK